MSNLDDLKAKWNRLSLFGKKTKGFKGQGQKLGTSDAPKSAVDIDRAVKPASSATLHSNAPSRNTTRLPPPQPKPADGTLAPGRKLGFSSNGSGSAELAFPAAPAAAASNAESFPRSLEPRSGAVAPAQSYGFTSHHPQRASEAQRASSNCARSAAEFDAAVEPPSEEVEAAVALLRSDSQGGAAAALLSKVLHNILSKPGEEKFRKLRLRNKKIQDEVVNVTGGLEFLQAVGFQLIFDDADGYAVFPEDEDLGQLRSALQALDLMPAAAIAAPKIEWSDSATAAAANGAAAAAVSQQQAQPAADAAAVPPRITQAAAASSQPRDRQTQVLLPDNPSTDVSEEVFRRTPADVKSAYLAERRKQEQGQMLMTREYRAKLAAGGTAKAKPAHGVIRIRLPDGLVLQGEFNAGEQVARIFEWVSDSLRVPSRTYELIMPARRPLAAAAGSLRQADLLPSVVLNLRWLERDDQPGKLPALRDEILAKARPSTS